MRRLEEEIKSKVIKASRTLDPDIRQKIEEAYQREEKEEARIVLKAILDDIEIAEKTSLPLCQDTGMACVFLEIGQDAYHDMQQEDDCHGIARELLHIGQARGHLEVANEGLVDEISRQEIAAKQSHSHGTTPCHGVLKTLRASPPHGHQRPDEDRQAA